MATIWMSGPRLVPTIFPRHGAAVDQLLCLIIAMFMGIFVDRRLKKSVSFWIRLSSCGEHLVAIRLDSSADSLEARVHTVNFC